MKIIKCFLGKAVFIMSCLVTTHAEKIEFTGQITEETCSTQSIHTNCKSINKILVFISNSEIDSKKIERLQQLSQSTKQMEIKAVKDKSHHILTINYH